MEKTMAYRIKKERGSATSVIEDTGTGEAIAVVTRYEGAARLVFMANVGEGRLNGRGAVVADTEVTAALDLTVVTKGCVAIVMLVAAFGMPIAFVYRYATGTL